MNRNSAQFWTTLGVTGTAEVTARARRLESDGWDGLGSPDSQGIAPDTYVSLAAAAVATKRILLSTSVTNLLSRHPAVTASAIASINLLSEGRARLGLGRGDSALANIGVAPPTGERFERYLTALRAYLDGRDVPFETIKDWSGANDGAPVKGRAPSASRLSWLGSDGRTIPIDVAASGKMAIELAARRADGVTLNMGADPDTLQWAIDLARRTRALTGLSPRSWSIGAYVAVVPSNNLTKARRMAAGTVATRARMAVMYGRLGVPVTESDRGVYAALASSYDMGRHGQNADHARGVPDDFIDRFAIVGAVSRCVERLQELVEIGIDRFEVGIGSLYLPAEEADELYRVTSERIIPAVRGR